jgi:hypothetical protein
MENRASKNRSLNIAFVLTPDLLKRLAVILREASEQLEFTVKFADGTSVHYDHIEEIIEQPNSEHRSIVGLIAGTAGESTQSANVVLKGKYASAEEPSVEYTLSGPQRSVVYLSDQLDDWVAATRQWYSRAFLPGFAIPLVFVAFLLPLYIWDHTSQFFLSQAQIKVVPGWAKLLAVVLMWVAEYFIFRLFPRGTFAIGKGATRQQFLSSVRWSVMVAFVVSFVGSIVANLLTRH